jgi:hypothetical protein
MAGEDEIQRLQAELADAYDRIDEASLALWMHPAPLLTACVSFVPRVPAV